jgi:cysteine desulfurase / selenocysteine lyase
MEPIDVDAARRETPGCDRVVHLNNAGASLMPTAVIDAVVRHIEQEAAMGGYEAADYEASQLTGVYSSAARLLNCHPDEIALFENSTLAWRAAMLSVPFERGDKILTGRNEYSSNVMACQEISRRAGVEVVAIDNDESGQIDVGEVERRLDDRVKLIALTHVPTNCGVVNPIAEVGRIAHEAGVPFLVDACQSVGQMDVDVREIGCDFLAVAGRKFLRAPRGTGLLYVRADRAGGLRPFMPEIGSTGWDAHRAGKLKVGARRFETWEAGWALRLGLGAAIDYAMDVGLDTIWARVSELATYLREQLKQVPGVAVEDAGVVKCAIVTFTVAGIEPKAVKDHLAAAGINVDIAQAARPCRDVASGDCVVRASVHYFNTERELLTLCDSLAELLPTAAVAV